MHEKFILVFHGSQSVDAQFIVFHLLLKSCLVGNDLKKPGTTSSITPNHGSAYLGGNLWERPSDDNDGFDFEYMDLDEFLSENGIPVDLDIADEKVGEGDHEDEVKIS